MLDDHAHVMQIKLCKANTRGVTVTVLWNDGYDEHGIIIPAMVLWYATK